LKAKVSKRLNDSWLIFKSKHSSFESTTATSLGGLVLSQKPLSKIVQLLSCSEFLVYLYKKFARSFSNKLTLRKESKLVCIEQELALARLAIFGTPIVDGMNAKSATVSEDIVHHLNNRSKLPFEAFEAGVLHV
jgi:hypothetical protein